MIKVKIIEIEGTPEEVAEYQRHQDMLTEKHPQLDVKPTERTKRGVKSTYLFKNDEGVRDFFESPKLKEGSQLKEVFRLIANSDEGCVRGSELEGLDPFQINGLMTGITRRCQKKDDNKNAALIKSEKSEDEKEQLYRLYDFEKNQNIHKDNHEALKAYFKV